PQGPLGPYATAPPALRPEGLSGSDWNGPAPSLRDRRAMEAWLGGAPGEGAAGPPGPGRKGGLAGAPSPPGHQVLEELGRGGMGVVSKARQVGLDRLVALKMILTGGHVGEAVLARFRTEAAALAQLQHPNIVSVFEVGEHQGLPFFSLELCPGGSLDSKL